MIQINVSIFCISFLFLYILLFILLFFLQLPLIKEDVGPSQMTSSCGDIYFPKTSPLTLPPELLSDQWQHLSIDIADARDLEKNTRAQSSSDMWKSERKLRITASNFGRFMVRKAPISEPFLNSLYTPFTSDPTTYGSRHEKDARQAYSNKTNLHVHDCGLVVNPEFPYLGGSPDGKVCDKGETGIIEIKCPYSIRNHSVRKALADEKLSSNVCLEKAGDEVRLKRSHQYWYQVQGNLMITGAPFCDFIVFTQCDLFIERILPDLASMKSLLQKLTPAYTDHVKRYLSAKFS